METLAARRGATVIARRNPTTTLEELFLEATRETKQSE
jgi:hypothetical protein